VVNYLSLLKDRLKVTDFQEHFERNLLDLEIITCKVNLGVFGVFTGLRK
jgi:hypothetical protein